MHQPFRGSYTVTVTPFTEDGSAIDVEAWKGFLDWQLEVGVPGVIVLGTTGEFLTVSDEERRLLVGHGDRARRGTHPGAGRRHERVHRRGPCATRARPRSSARTG